MVANPIKTERIVSDWYRNIHTGVRRTSAIARSSDPSLATFFAEDQAQSSRTSTEYQKAIEGLMKSANEKTLFKEIGEQRKAYILTRDKIWTFKKEGKADEANQLALNAAVEEMAAAASSLKSQAQDLVQVVSVFKLGPREGHQGVALPAAAVRSHLRQATRYKGIERRDVGTAKGAAARTRSSAGGNDDWETF